MNSITLPRFCNLSCEAELPEVEKGIGGALALLRSSPPPAVPGRGLGGSLPGRAGRHAKEGAGSRWHPPTLTQVN